MNNMISINDIPEYTRKDFVSDQVVRWCPGCGDYAILASIQKVMPELGVRKENIVFVSGIGCSSRFPYYMDTYGLHTVHGRAPTLATGIKITNPELSVWVVTGDGDGLSIGGNHTLHMCRRNVDLNVLLFNNRIYGLTKGQYSPTSPVGIKTKSTPMGAIDRDLNPLALALGAEATFIARTLDADGKHMESIFLEGAKHKGTSFMEILQNCVIFNDGAWEHVADRAKRSDNALYLEHGKPMIFGKDNNKGIRANGFALEVVTLGENGITEADLLVHNQHDRTLAWLLANLDFPAFPVPMGVLYAEEAPVYERELIAQVETAKSKRTPDLKALFHADDTWVVEGEAPHDEGTLRGQVFGQTDVASEFDEAYIDDMKGEAPISGISDGEVHEGLATDPVAKLVDFSRVLITLTADDDVGQAVKLMQEKNIGALVVVDAAHNPIGIFTEYDVLQKVATQISNLQGAQVRQFMTANPDVLPAYAPIAQALHLMHVHQYRHVPIVNESGQVMGIISFRDVVHYIQQFFDA